MKDSIDLELNRMLAYLIAEDWEKPNSFSNTLHYMECNRIGVFYLDMNVEQIMALNLGYSQLTPKAKEMFYENPKW